MQSFQRITKLFFSAWLPLLVFASCAKDRWGDGSNGTGQDTYRNNYVVFFDIRTLDNAATRASSSDIEEAGNGDLVYGSENEHAIGRGNYAFFFDEKGILMAISDVYLDNEQHNTDDSKEDVKNNDGSIKDNIEARYEARFEVDRENLPHSCLLLLNGLRFQDELDDIRDAIESESGSYKIDDILALMDKAAKNENPLWIGRDGDDHEYFTMTNSVYVKDGTLQAATLIPEDLIQDTRTYDPEKVLTVYVERMVAKFTFELPTEGEGRKKIFNPNASPLMLFDGINNIGTTNYKGIPWQIELQGWGINAVETETYVFKKIDQEGSNYPSYWNDAPNYRTYWSVDPHYDVKDDQTSQPNYPWQYRNMLDRTYSEEGNKISDYVNFHYYEKKHKAEQDQNILRNYSYNDLVKDNDINFSRVVYVPENTYDYISDEENFAKSLDQRPHLLAGTHLLVGAELQTDFSDIPGYAGGFKPNDLYRDRYGIYYKSEEDCFKSLVHAFNRLLSSQSSMNFTYYNWDGTGDNRLNGKIFAIRPTLSDKEDTYVLFYDEKSVSKDSDFSAYDLAVATIRNGDGRRLPWPTTENKAGGKEINLSIRSQKEAQPLTSIYYSRDTEADPWVPADIDFDQNVVKSLLFEWFGPIDHFHSGMMYYSKPVQNPSTVSNFYGVVRNSWYCFQLSDVTNLGTSVDDPSQPIVPLVIETHDQINVRIKIMEWHEVDRDIYLPKSNN